MLMADSFRARGVARFGLPRFGAGPNRELPAIADEKRNDPQRRNGSDGLAAFEFLSAPCVRPRCAGGEINFSFGIAGMENGRDEQIRAE
jgi:hypothetical protein